MPTPEWREEKTEYVVKSICEALIWVEAPEAVRKELQHALYHALKILADAIEEQQEGARRWSIGLVDLFYDHPELCEHWLEMMKKPDFDAKSLSENIPGPGKQAAAPSHPRY